jgi:hypothetical protein
MQEIAKRSADAPDRRAQGLNIAGLGTLPISGAMQQAVTLPSPPSYERAGQTAERAQRSAPAAEQQLQQQNSATSTALAC